MRGHSERAAPPDLSELPAEWAMDEFRKLDPGSRLGRAGAEALERAASARENFQSSGEWHDAWSAFAWATELLIDVVGVDILHVIHGEDLPEAEPLPDRLDLLARRLAMAARIFPNERMSSHSLSAASIEISAIARGDATRMFIPPRKSQGRLINAYWLARHQLRALEWNAALKGRGASAADAQNPIGVAFGTTWAAIARWKTQVTRELGDQAYERAIRLAAKGNFDGTMFSKSEEDIQERLKLDGLAYQAELKRRVVAI